MRTFFTMLGVDCAAKVSLAMQFIASFCWAVGAVLAGPMNVADFLQLSAAVAWCIANFAFRFCVQPGSWNTAQVTNMVIMFSFAYAFNQDVSSWTGTAATTAQVGMFSGATAFQAKYTCSTSGPASSCDTIKSTWVAPSSSTATLDRTLWNHFCECGRLHACMIWINNILGGWCQRGFPILINRVFLNIY